jgi:hypothetical protein
LFVGSTAELQKMLKNNVNTETKDITPKKWIIMMHISVIRILKR